MAFHNFFRIQNDWLVKLVPQRIKGAILSLVIRGYNNTSVSFS